jgi:hypothetical protein
MDGLSGKLGAPHALYAACAGFGPAIREIGLVLWYMGEEYVAPELVSEDETGSIRRTRIGSGTAHTGHQMRRPWTNRLGGTNSAP